MKSKKGLISFIFLLLCAAAVFVIGWVQLYVPVDSYGVLVSKTNGVDPEVIQSGTIIWKWQKLIPTNTEIYIFDAKNEKQTVSVSGKLPSADIYSALIEGRPDFSYAFSFEIEAAIQPEALPRLVKGSGVRNESDLSALLSKACNDAADDAASLIIDSLSSASDSLVSFADSSARLLEKVREKTADSDVVITGIKVVSSKLPDVQLYAAAKDIYAAYLSDIKNAISKTTGSQIELASDDFLLIERFGKLGKVLTEYPILIDYLAVTRDDPDGALGLLDILHGKTE